MVSRPQKLRDKTARHRVGRRQFLLLPACIGLANLSGLFNSDFSVADQKLEEESPTEDTSLIKLFLCGDVMTGRGIDQILPYPGSPRICEPYATSAMSYVTLAEDANGPIKRPVAFDYIWGDALGELAARPPDLRIINLETSITTSEDCVVKGINYRMSPKNLPCLIAAGIDCCTLANNHVLDWGRAGLIETLESLATAGIKSPGAGRNRIEAAAPAVFEVPGKGRVLVVSFGTRTSGIPRDWAAAEGHPGVNLLTELSEAALEGVAAGLRPLRQRRDIVIASIHWGTNWGYEIEDPQVAFAHGLIDKVGVDVVHGHSSHHPRAIEVYRNKLILYGCGDFLNDYEGIRGYERFRDDLVLMYFPTISLLDGTLIELTMVPLQIRNMRLNRATSADASWLGTILNREGERFGTNVRVEDGNVISLRWT